MALPEIVGIVPPAALAPAVVTIPGSKSITNRALILAALADGETRLRGALWSDDTEIMVEALRALGFEIGVAADPGEAANRTIAVFGRGGRIPNAGNDAAPLEIFVGNAGTAARFLLPLLCLGGGVYRMSGSARMHERPQAALFAALRQLGYRLDAEGGRLPAVVRGEAGGGSGACVVSIEESSQFASALLLSARRGGWRVSVSGEDAEESAYVALTTKLIDVFPTSGGDFQVEPDCSSASYFLAAGAILPEAEVAIASWPEGDWQPDGRFSAFLQRFRAGDETEYRDISRLHDLGDAIMTAIVIAPLLPRASRFVDLGRLRLQESERVAALHRELERCGARLTESGDALTIAPSALHGAEIETYDDHRLAMCFSALGLRVPGMRIRNPGCVAKTFPNFYAKLAAAPPAGLGATILDATSGRRLTGADLIA